MQFGVVGAHHAGGGLQGRRRLPTPWAPRPPLSLLAVSSAVRATYPTRKVLLVVSSTRNLL